MTSTLPTAADLARHIADGSVRACDVVEDCLGRVARSNGSLHAFVEVFAESAMAQAEQVDRARAANKPLGPLAGVPVAIKDNLLLQGHVAACGSRMLEQFVAPYTATALARLQQLGAILIGRTNMDEFGMGSSTEHSAFGPTRNPWAPDRVPGGSSGGAAAAVAAGFCPLAVGTDTGGSVRQPAAMCGVTGLKPTYGRISRRGLVAYASSLDCIGLLGHEALDLALAMAIAGYDAGDSTSVDTPLPDLAAALRSRSDLRGLRLGVPPELGGDGIDCEVAAAVQGAIDQLCMLGARLAPCSLPSVGHAVATYYLIAAAEAASNLARYDGVRYGLRRNGDGRLDSLYEASRSAGFGAECQLRILLGTFALQAGYQDEVYGKATAMRAHLRSEFARAYADCDLIVSATSPVPAFPIGSRNDDPLAMYLGDALTVPQSLAGLPAISLPCGLTKAGLPVGLQLTAPAWHEGLLLQTAHCFQAATNWHRQRPPL